MCVNVSCLYENADALIKFLQDDAPLATRIKKEVDQLMNIIEIENKTLQLERQRNSDLKCQVMDNSSKDVTKSTHEEEEEEEEEEVNLIIQNVKKKIDNLNHSS
jgi:hypothetical protein